MSKLDNPVGSYASIDSAPTDKGPGDEFTLTVSTISDGAVTWTSSDTDIAEVEGTGTTATVIAKRSGKVTITADVAATENYQAGSASCEVTLRVHNFDHFKSDIANAAGSKEIVVLLAENANIDLISEDASNSPFKFTVDTQILGVEGKPATFNVNTKKPPFDIQAGFVVKNASFNINSSGNINFLQVRTPTTAKLPKDNGTASSYVAFNPIIIENVDVNNQNSCLLKGQGNVRFDNIEVRNCRINMREKCNSGIFNFDSGYPEMMLVENSTFWSKGKGHSGFLFTASGKPTDITSASTATFTVDHCTMYKIGVGKKVNNGNYLKGKAFLTVNLTNSILVDFGTSTGNEINGWLFGQNASDEKTGGVVTQQKPNRTYGYNSYFTSDGNSVSGWTDSSKGGDDTNTSLTTYPAFADAENGDFTVSGSDQKSKQTGDPRWLK